MNEPVSNDAERWAVLRALLEDAMELPQSERLAFLRQTVADPLLRAEAEQLLGFQTDASQMFAFPVSQGDVIGDQAPEEPLPGSTAGNYRVLREIGRGGMGTVYLAERADGAYEQQVAIKVLRESIDSAELARRFRMERQILAGLTHPGIARLLDGGVTAAGRPFLVLEYVAGRSIDRFCEEENLDVPARLALFLRVAEAVQAAHQQLVLHLDIKPGNILITDGGEPRLLDFGIARLLSGDAANGGEVQPSVLLMTPRYASPEQALGKALGVGSDVFSLSTLLYRLLTGKLPYPIEDATPLEAARMISETKPRLPSEATSPDTAARLRGDLDLILLQGLHKDSARRYRTVAAMMEDIERHLAFRPVLAHRDSLGYRATKFLRRNWIASAATALVVVAMSISIALVLRSSATARRERASAEHSAQRAEQQTVIAESAAVVAERERSAARLSATEAEQQRNAAQEAERHAEQERIAAQQSAAAAVTSAAEATKQRATSEQHLSEMTKLSSTLVDQFMPELYEIPGTLGARTKILATLSNFLEGVAKTSGDNPEVRSRLASTYYSMAILQGANGGPALKDPEAAMKSFHAALALTMPDHEKNPNDVKAAYRVGVTEVAMDYPIAEQGKTLEAIETLNRAWSRLQLTYKEAPSRRWRTLALLCALQAENYALDNQWSMLDPDAAMVWTDRGIAIMRGLGESDPALATTNDFQGMSSHLQFIRGNLLEMLGRYAEAAAIYEHELAALAPRRSAQDLTINAGWWMFSQQHSQLLLQRGELERATAIAETMRPRKLHKSTEAADPSWDREEEARQAGWMAEIDLRNGHLKEGMQEMDLSLSASRTALQSAPWRTSLIISHMHHLIRFAENPGVPAEQQKAMYLEALPLAEKYTANNPRVLSSQADEARIHTGLARLAAHAGDSATQRNEMEKARTALRSLQAQRPHVSTLQDIAQQLDALHRP